MNIHITDLVLFESLKNATIAKVIVGSHLYGTNNQNSDIDYLYIYATSENELLSPFKSHHQLQYIEDGIDHNFVSLHNFITNSLSGDSTINFEVIQSGSLNNTELEWIDVNKNTFINYSIIRSYLGMARRDVKFFGKYSSERDKLKRFGHIIRGTLYSESLINNTFNFKECNENLLIEISKVDYNSSKELRSLSNKISKLREELTECSNNNDLNISKIIDFNDGVELNNLFINFTKTASFKSKQSHLSSFDMSIFINSIENWVTYSS